MKTKMHIEETRLTHSAKGDTRALRVEMDRLLARQRSLEATMRLGLDGTLDMLKKGDVEKAQILLLMMKGIIDP